MRIGTLEPASTEEAVRLLGRAFVTNPVNAAALGPGELARNEAFFRAGLRVMKGPKLAALDDASRIVGVIHWVDSPRCQPAMHEKLGLIPALLAGVGVRATGRVLIWTSAWAKRDPVEPHVHLGPIGVDPSAQGRGVGRRLMELHCEELDRSGSTGYLETDRPENVAFYARFGFEVVAEAPVLGVTNYFMRRRSELGRPQRRP